MQEVAKIPFGKTLSYSQLAEKSGLKGRERYVAGFLKHNPFLVAIPCHRVIRKNGDYGDYALGKQFKKYLLAREKEIIGRKGQDCL